MTDQLTHPPQEAEYVLIIEALDTGEPRQMSRVEVKVMVPFNVAPKVDEHIIFRIKENIPIGSVAGIVNAVDPNPGETVFFEMVDNSGKLFYM